MCANCTRGVIPQFFTPSPTRDDTLRILKKKKYAKIETSLVGVVRNECGNKKKKEKKSEEIVYNIMGKLY